MATDACVSPAMWSQWPGVWPGVRSTVRKYAPARTGESMSVTSDTGANTAGFADSPAAPVFSAVAYFHPAGSFSDGENLVSLSLGPCGYRSTLHQFTTASCAVAVVEPLNGAT